MKPNVKDILDELIERYPSLLCNKEDISQAFDIINNSYRNDGTLFCCGNGGSCADCDHIVGELLKSFKFKRSIDAKVYNFLKNTGAEDIASKLEGALPAVSLCGHNALTTAFINDTDPLLTYAQQIYGLGRNGDVLIAISTSGNSKNCCYAVQTAHAKGIKTIALTGRDGGKLAEICDCAIIVPANETFKIQELHLPIYHCICAMLEEEFFGI